MKRRKGGRKGHPQSQMSSRLVVKKKKFQGSVCVPLLLGTVSSRYSDVQYVENFQHFLYGDDFSVQVETKMLHLP